MVCSQLQSQVNKLKGLPQKGLPKTPYFSSGFAQKN
jgi:hypothetical protein